MCVGDGELANKYKSKNKSFVF